MERLMKEKYGFVYLWFDRKHKRYYVGCHWGTTDDGYICSSRWMRKSYNRRPEDFKRRILKSGLTREGMYIEEQRYFDMIKPEQIKERYYNLCLKSKNIWHKYGDQVLTVGKKISIAKTGKPVKFKDPTERARKISEGKRKAFEKRLEETGQKMPIGHKCGKASKPHTEEWKQKNSERMILQWSDGTRSKEDTSNRMLGNKYNRYSQKETDDGFQTILQNSKKM